MGQELWLADQLLSSTNGATRQTGLQLAEQARQQALTVGESPWLAARICEAFIWPNLDVAEGGVNLAADQLLVSAGLTFRQADETNNYIKNAELLIKKARNPARADHARFQLGLLYENMGNFEAALAQYRAIQNTNGMVSAARRIPTVEEKLKAIKGK
jgi:tetratricopeptide (TPR) repeat protein